MFGLTFEKLFIVAVIAGVVIGPQRLPVYAHRLGEWIRAVRAYVESSRAHAEADLGVPLTREQWQSLDLRQYHPRRIVQDALAEAPAPDPHAEPDPRLAEAARIRPGQQYLVTGSAAHPRRVRIDTLADDDPRRLAALGVLDGATGEDATRP